VLSDLLPVLIKDTRDSNVEKKSSATDARVTFEGTTASPERTCTRSFSRSAFACVRLRACPRGVSRSTAKHCLPRANQTSALGAGTRGPAARPARARPPVHANAPPHTQRTF